MRRAAKRDGVEAAIVEHLTSMGYSVLRLSSEGAPDLLVGRAGKTWLLECKRKGGSLTPAQRTMLQNWRGSPVWVVTSPGEAYEAITILTKILEEKESAVAGG